MAATVDDIVQVSDDAILKAMRVIHSLVGIVVEPAGAVGVAAAMTAKDRFVGRLVATPLCGSNLTKTQVAKWL